MLGAGLIARYHAASLRRSGAAAVLGPVYDPHTARARRSSWAVSADGGRPRRDRGRRGLRCRLRVHLDVGAPPPRRARLWRGRAVFCEKPLATDLSGARAMTASVTRAGVVNQVGLVLRSAPGFALLRHLVTDPEAGRIAVSVVFRDDQQIPLGGYYASERRADRRRAAGRGRCSRTPSTTSDLVDWLAGPITVVSAHAGQRARP